MKKSAYLKLSCLILLSILSSQPVSARMPEGEMVPALQKVTVFTDRAMIAKEALLTVKKGENIIRFSGITQNLVDQSVQVTLSGQSDLAISEVAVEETFLKKTDQPEIQKLQTRLNALNSQIREVSDQISVIGSENEFLKKVNPFPQNIKVTIADMEAHARFLEKTLAANLARIEVEQLKLKKLDEDKIALENELAALTSGKNKSKTIVIHLLSSAAKSGVKLGFTYVSTQAGWSSQYEAKGDFNASKIDFNYFASIWQSTGEDWSDATVEISTARPFVYGNIPELSPWYVDVFTPHFFKSRSLAAMDRSNAPQAMMAQAAAPMVENELKETEIQEENTSFTFVLPRKVDIVSDGEPHRVSISKSTAEAKYSWFTIPKLIQNAFLKATMKNPFAFPLLSGPVSVFFDQKLVGTASINTTVLADGELELSLGIDEGIKIDRKLVKKYTDYAGLINKETTVNYEYAIVITNGKSKEITLDLNDQFPISRNEKIRVELKTPKGDEALVNEEAKITWKITLAPGAKKSIPVKFSVSYPKEMNVSGL